MQDSLPTFWFGKLYLLIDSGKKFRKKMEVPYL